MNIFRNMLYMARRFKTATVLNFIGLTVALTAFYLLMTQVVYNISIIRVSLTMSVCSDLRRRWDPTLRGASTAIVLQTPSFRRCHR